MRITVDCEPLNPKGFTESLDLSHITEAEVRQEVLSLMQKLTDRNLKITTIHFDDSADMTEREKR